MINPQMEQQALFESLERKFVKSIDDVPVTFIAIGASDSGKSYTRSGKSLKVGCDIGLIGRFAIKLISTFDTTTHRIVFKSIEISNEGIFDINK